MAERRTQRHFVSGKNSLRYWPEIVHPIKVVFNFCVLYTARFSPSFCLKNFLYRMIGVRVGHNASLAPGVMLDMLFPEQIEIGDNVVIGLNTTVVAHEFLVREWRIGKVIIEKDVTIGANCMILPGVIIGEGAVVSAMSLVNRDIPARSFWGGVPVREIRPAAEKE
jgi:acetyltransferase-like isoleucine patch superfamily enzyme